MTQSVRHIAPVLVLALTLVGCDGGLTNDWAQPRISVHLVNPGDTIFAKSAAPLTVSLSVMTLAGNDFSPPDQIVDNAVDSEVTFEVTVPPDSVYSFRVEFRDGGGTLVGEGAVITEVVNETAQVVIPVVVANGNQPMIALIPSGVRSPVHSGNLDLAIRFYGTAASLSGVAAVFSIQGQGPESISVEAGPNVVLSVVEQSDGALSVGWQFNTPTSGNVDLGRIVIPFDRASDFCLEIAAGNARTVTPAGAITKIPATGACIEIGQ